MIVYKKNTVQKCTKDKNVHNTTTYTTMYTTQHCTQHNIVHNTTTFTTQQRTEKKKYTTQQHTFVCLLSIGWSNEVLPRKTTSHFAL